MKPTLARATLVGMRCLAFLLIAVTACSRPHIQGISTIEEEDAPLASAIRAGDPAVDLQFASGFYPAEQDGWRWTRGYFTAMLLAPPDAAAHGALLELRFDVPEVVINRLGPVTLSATISGIPLEPQTRSHPGIEPYRKPIPAKVFSKREVLVEFSLDKVIESNSLPGEDRELGVVVHAVALLPNASTP